ncbi:MAG TPA: low temperature requirement protein A [Solirubrobacter sp.]|nr:low temperature requirement protein A [Solirubrobacter sp.]
MTLPLHHRRNRREGRDPDETHRVATPLELLFDLTFVVAFGIAADEMAHYLAEDHVRTAVLGFAMSAFAIMWAWINFSWFASAYDTDDWLYRLTTMVQMVGVVILALGLAPVFESIDEGEHVDNRVMVAGYVVMRVAMVFQWARAAGHDPPRRAAATTYIVSILIAQAGWIALLLANTSVGVTFLWIVVLVAVEFAGPWIAERYRGGTPWHPHHIAERYGLLVIIALGEGIIGTIASMAAIVGPEGPGWSVDAALVALAGVGLTFGLWWTYFVVPCGEILHLRREKSFGWGYGQIPIIGAVVAIGGGLHVAAYYIEEESVLGAGATMLCVAIPVAVYVLGLYALYTYLASGIDGFHVLLLALSVAVVAVSLLMAAGGVSMAWCLLVLSLTPWVTVIGYELHGHERNARVLESLH